MKVQVFTIIYNATIFHITFDDISYFYSAVNGQRTIPYNGHSYRLVFKRIPKTPIESSSIHHPFSHSRVLKIELILYIYWTILLSIKVGGLIITKDCYSLLQLRGKISFSKSNPFPHLILGFGSSVCIFFSLFVFDISFVYQIIVIVDFCRHF